MCHHFQSAFALEHMFSNTKHTMSDCFESRVKALIAEADGDEIKERIVVSLMREIIANNVFTASHSKRGEVYSTLLFTEKECAEEYYDFVKEHSLDFYDTASSTDEVMEIIDHFKSYNQKAVTWLKRRYTQGTDSLWTFNHEGISDNYDEAYMYYTIVEDLDAFHKGARLEIE